MSLIHLYNSHKGKASDKWESYLQEYDSLLMPLMDKNIGLLEIGVQNGGSLEIWEKYFGSLSIIIGCDIDASCKKLNFKSDRTHVVIGDAGVESTEKKILNIKNNFDLIIDDGSHKSGDIISTFLRYFPHVVDGGYYIIEDLHCSYFHDYNGGIYHPYSSLAFLKKIVDIVNYQHWGVQIGREQILQQFVKEYGLVVDKNSLATIHSIKFTNSLCVINKQPLPKNALGRRIIGGDIEEISTGDLKKVKNSELGAPQQDSNYWSTLQKAPEYYYGDLLKELHQLENENKLFSEEVFSLKGSLSWKITSPLRFIINLLRQAARVLTKRFSRRDKDAGGQA